jgi:ATP-dependent 26S proteasome regulatory subunit
MKDSLNDHIQKGLLSQYPLFFVLCREEERLQKQLARISRDHYGDDRPVITWTAARGVENGSTPGPVSALEMVRSIADSDRDCFYILKDLPALLDNDPVLVRALRDLYYQLADRNRFVFLSHPMLKLPEELKNHVWVVNLGMPSEPEIYGYMKELVASRNLGDTFSEDWFFQCASAMKGMTLDEVRHLMVRLFNEGKHDIEATLPDIYEEKATALIKEGCVQFIPKIIPVDEVGGLDNLKEWVLSRKALFSRQAFEAGIPLPAGILFMGVSGCGKSMAAKVIASAWSLPLIRLDMNLVMSGAYGSPEFAFDHALKVAEHISPVVLWIDEMENSFGYDSMGGATGGNSSIFSSFLTWMQEKPTSIFVVATANRIEKLPAEVIRKGRFDQLFFLDLPTDSERRAIFRIHIKRYGADPDTFNMNLLSIVTKDWSGAEIEQAVKSARIHAYQEERMFTEKDITYATGRMVPLSRTMEEQIKALRQWSLTRATPASKKES